MLTCFLLMSKFETYTYVFVNNAILVIQYDIDFSTGFLEKPAIFPGNKVLDISTIIYHTHSGRSGAEFAK